MESWREELYLAHGWLKKGEERAGHKYIKREWKNGKWVYYYELPSLNTRSTGSTKTGQLKLLTRLSDWFGLDEKKRMEDATKKLDETVEKMKKKDELLEGRKEKTEGYDFRKDGQRGRQRNITGDKNNPAQIFKRKIPDSVNASAADYPQWMKDNYNKPNATHEHVMAPNSVSHTPTYTYKYDNSRQALVEYMTSIMDYANTPMGKIHAAPRRAINFINKLFKKKG